MKSTKMVDYPLPLPSKATKNQNTIHIYKLISTHHKTKYMNFRREKEKKKAIHSNVVIFQKFKKYLQKHNIPTTLMFIIYLAPPKTTD